MLILATNQSLECCLKQFWIIIINVKVSLHCFVWSKTFIIELDSKIQCISYFFGGFKAANPVSLRECILEDLLFHRTKDHPNIKIELKPWLQNYSVYDFWKIFVQNLNFFPTSWKILASEAFVAFSRLTANWLSGRNHFTVSCRYCNSFITVNASIWRVMTGCPLPR